MTHASELPEPRITSRTVARVALAVTALLLLAGYAGQGRVLVGLGAAALIGLGEFGRSSPKRYIETRLIIANATFAFIVCCLVAGTYMLVPLPLLIITLLVAIVYWDIDAIHWRLAQVEPTPETQALIQRHYRALALFSLASVALLLIANVATLDVSTWAIIATAFFSFVALSILIRRLSDNVATE